jgi:hypothetical protein
MLERRIGTAILRRSHVAANVLCMARGKPSRRVGFWSSGAETCVTRTGSFSTLAFTEKLSTGGD